MITVSNCSRFDLSVSFLINVCQRYPHYSVSYPSHCRLFIHFMNCQRSFHLPLPLPLPQLPLGSFAEVLNAKLLFGPVLGAYQQIILDVPTFLTLAVSQGHTRNPGFSPTTTSIDIFQIPTLGTQATEIRHAQSNNSAGHKVSVRIYLAPLNPRVEGQSALERESLTSSSHSLHRSVVANFGCGH